ncbi:MAG: ABC transporter permease [Betaproteobacteria bacterium]
MIRLAALAFEAFRALGAHPLRTALAMLGMIVGVSSVVIMLAVAQGSQERVRQTMRTLGANVLVVNSGASVASGVRQASGATPTLSLGDAAAIRALDTVRAVSPTTWNTAQIVFEGQNWLGPVQGSHPDIFEVRDWVIASGSIFEEADVRSGARKAVIGATLAEKLFSGADPTGQTIRIRNVPFTVVGLLARKGQTLDGWDLDDIIYVPLSTARRDLFGSAFPDRVHRMLVEAVSAPALAQAEADIRLLLRTRHRIAEGAEDDFVVRRQDAFYDAEQRTASTMRTLLATIASVSLLVGGIGIMNIMLVTVAERTREVGLRMAVGATRRDIAAQFLCESVVICVAGGLAGLAAGILGSWIAADRFGMNAIVSIPAAVAALGASVVAGLLFGLYPALRAAAMSPAKALRAD